ncbi:MAG: ATP-binding protein [Candidatus Promineifilaceae bacterium]|jgi:serine/threonine-protein kinase RsbW
MKTLRLPGRVGSLAAIGDYIIQAAAKARLDEQAAYGLRLAVDEIATNAIVHGYQKIGQIGELVLRAEQTVTTLIVVLEDTSPPYDPRQTPPPDFGDQELGERPSGGLGIYLARQGVDAYRYDCIGGTNRHTFMMNRTQ